MTATWPDRHDLLVPELVASAVPAGRLRDHPQPSFAFEELTLRPFRPSDAAAVTIAYRDPDIQRWHGRSMTDLEAEEWTAACESRWLAETGANWAVVDDRDTLLGRVGFRGINLHEGVAEIAYWTTPPARGRNVAPRAVRALSSWMLEDVGLHRLELNHSTANVASCRVAAKSGFAYEGTRRQLTLHQDGWHDMHIHGRIAADGLVEQYAARSPSEMQS